MLESFPLYTQDFLHGPKLDGLGAEARGVLVGMWCLCARDGAVSDDPAMIARMIGESPEVVERNWLRLLPLFHQNKDGSLYSRRIKEESDWAKEVSLKRRQAGIAGNLVRWSEPRPAPKPRKTRPKTTADITLTDLKAGSVEPFEEVWSMWPMKTRKQNRKTGEWEVVPVERGHRAPAERAFQRIVDSGAATPEMLYLCAFAYLKDGDMVKKGYVQHVSTFFGPELRTWTEFLHKARALRDQEVVGES